MKIALIAPCEEPVPPKKYGGVELIIYLLTENLVKRGHEVHLFASKDSKTSAILHPYAFKAIRKTLDLDLQARARRIYSDLIVAETLKVLSKERFDIIHNHAGWRPIIYSSLMKGRMLTTLHGPLDDPFRQITYGWVKNHPFVSISNAQRRPAKNLRFVATVYNGIDISKFQPRYKPGRYLAFLGRMSPEKGPREAIDIALKLKLPLVMAAKIDPVDMNWFNQFVKPKIDGKKVKYIGEIGHKRKVSFLRNALALLAPIQWEEPFGLYFIEALACGTPVITYPRGSVPEIINPEVGVILPTKKEIEREEILEKLSKISRRHCRLWAQQKFSAERMVEDYLKVYKKLIKR